MQTYCLRFPYPRDDIPSNVVLYEPHLGHCASGESSFALVLIPNCLFMNAIGLYDSLNCLCETPNASIECSLLRCCSATPFLSASVSNTLPQMLHFIL